MEPIVLMRRGAPLALAIALAGCLEDAAINCADGTVCPLDRVCIPGGCALAEQLAACDGLLDGSSCVFSGIAGECLGGVCLGSQCGNGEIDDGEACDDGNVVSGDGCRADCAKSEVCGDNVLDENEGCDDGNANPADGCDGMCQPTMWVPSTLLGGMANATVVGLQGPSGVAVDTLGNLYIADTQNHRIQRVDTNGVLTTIAGTGVSGFDGDNGPATSARLYSPEGVAVDGLGNVYIADTFNQRVRRVDPMGSITTLAGGGFGPLGDGGPASGAALSYPSGIAVDGLGNVYIADSVNDRIRKIDTNGVITTIAGTVGGFSGDGGLATAAGLNSPKGVALDTAGRVIIADTGNQRIRRIETNGNISTIAGASTGCGTFCSGGFAGDGGQATSALLSDPSHLTVRSDGIYFADFYNSRIRRIDGAGVITTVAGGAVEGFGGDGGAATAAALDNPAAVVASPTGHLFVADSRNNRIRAISPAGIISTIAGSGSPGYSGDGLRATSAVVSSPLGVAVDAAGNLYIAEQANNRIRRVTPDGVITTVAGTGQQGYRATDDGGRAVTAWLDQPSDVDVDAIGNLFIADTNNHRIRKVNTAGIITTVAGSGVSGYDGDDALATTKAVSAPSSVTHDPAGNLYIAEPQSARVRRVDTAGVITTFAGTGVAGTSTDGGAATASKLQYPWGLAFHGGQLYIADLLAFKVRRVDATGKLFTAAGNGTQATAGDGGAATSASLGGPRDVAFDAAGAMYIADQLQNRVRRVSSTGTITTLVGTGGSFNSGDGGGVAGAQLGDAMGVATDAAGNVYIASRIGNRVRRVSSGILTTVAGLVDPRGLGPLATATLADPRQLVVAGPFMIAAGGGSGTVQLVRPTTVEVGAGRYDQLGATGQLARYRAGLFGTVQGVAYDASTSILYFTETSANRIHAVSVVNAADVSTWTIASFANTAGTSGFADGPAATARFRNPTGLYLDAASHQLYVADTGNHVIRAVDVSAGPGAATVRTIAGVPATLGYFGDGGVATSALLYSPSAITRCANGDLFVADTGNHRVRRIETGTTLVSTVLGDGIAASSGEGSPSSSFPVHSPLGITCDNVGNVLVTSTTTVRMLAASDNGIVDGTRGVQTIYGAPPRTMFPESVTSCLTGIASVDMATVRIVDACTGLLVELRQEKR